MQQLERRAVELHQPRAAQRGGDDRHRLRGELLDRPIAVLARPEVDLGDGVATEARHDVDEQAELDAPALHERQHLDCFPTRRVLTAERLRDVGQLREQQRKERAGDQLRDAAAAGGRAFERAGVAGLHQQRVGVEQQGLEELHDALGPEVGEVGVDPADDVAPARVQRLPQRVALARAGPGFRQHVGLGDHSCTRGAGGRGGRVGRAVIDHDHLVDEPVPVDVPDQRAADLSDDAADRRRFVARRQAHGDRERERTLHRYEIGGLHNVSLCELPESPFGVLVA